MREILFRGKRSDTSEWVYGSLIIPASESYPTIIETHFADLGRVKIDPATVGQYTGLKDKNKKKIFEGDRLGRAYGFYTVRWDNSHSAFRLINTSGNSLTLSDDICNREIIGNIHSDSSEGEKEETNGH